MASGKSRYAMEVTNNINANAAQMAGFAEPGADGPIYMLNLLKYRARAKYADGRETELLFVKLDASGRGQH
jgi:hypothetical protein